MENELIPQIQKGQHYSYNKKETPECNYLNFEESILLNRGLEFKTEKVDNSKSQIYLVSTPLGNDVETAKKILEEFYTNLKNHLDEINTKEDMFTVYETFINLNNAVNHLHIMYKNGSDVFFGYNFSSPNVYKDLRKLKIPLYRTFNKFLYPEGNTLGGLKYDELGTEIKLFIKKLYNTKRKAHTDFRKYMNETRDLIFFDREKKYYTYTGETTDIIEIALMLTLTKKVNILNSSGDGATEFCRNFCHFFGLPFSKLGNYINGIVNRSSNKKDLFLKRGADLLDKYIEKRVDKL